MGKSAVSFRIKTPHSSIETTDSKKAFKEFYEEIERRSFGISFQKLSDSVTIAENRHRKIIATFFQRVCARTPLDEKYVVYVKESGEEVYHIPNDQRCRFDWYIECNGKRVTGEDLVKRKSDVFNDYNNSESIKFIYDTLKSNFSDLDKCVIGNNNPYFAILEYGGYEKDSSEKQGIVEKPFETGEKHGVKNLHSVQAPVGMLRVTQMELEEIARTSDRDTVSQRFRKRGTYAGKNLSKTQLKKLISKFKASKRLPLKDIKTFIEVY